jgi:pseudouridine-5'-phosphate glycosidase
VNAGRPRVALESTLITHGLAWPRNLEAARRAESAVRASGAEPATIAILGGEVVVGLSDAQLEQLARAEEPMKASRGTLALALEAGAWAGTTVSATMILAARAGITVFATGGIGGVHRGGAVSMDVSSDLDELARTSMIVVCSGPKSILDVDLTIEYLETRGVPVVGWKTLELAGFYAVGSGRMLAGSVDGAGQAAELARRHWGLGMASGLVVAVPAPDGAALARDVADAAIDRAVAEAAAAGVHGPASTPWILARVAELTDGRSIEANLALIENNARVAGEIAVALAAPEARRV